jgi:hypothetical protein
MFRRIHGRNYIRVEFASPRLSARGFVAGVRAGHGALIHSNKKGLLDDDRRKFSQAFCWANM